MTDNEVWDFLSNEDRIFVAFPAPDGFPHITPVWFCVIDKKIYFRTQDYKVKADLARSGKVSCCIDEGKRYPELRGVVIWGKSTIVTDENIFKQASAKLDEKYKEEWWRESEMPQQWVLERRREKRVCIEIDPVRISSWDNGKVVRASNWRMQTL